MRCLSLWILGIFLAAQCPDAQACKRMDSPAQKLKGGYETGAIAAVALVTISSATYIRKSDGDAHPWRASASVSRVLRGNYASKSLAFERGWGSAACDDGEPAPKSGTKWAVYFWKKPDGTLAVWNTYPADVANSADPKLKGRIK
jgi:hypothetical protein